MFIFSMFSFQKTNVVKKAKTIFEEFLGSSKYSEFQQQYSFINFNEPILKEQLINGDCYLMVYVIYCWDDICYNDHECRLDFGIDKVVLKELKNDNYEFIYVNDENKTSFRLFEKFFQDKDIEHTGNFFYRFNEDFFIK